MANTDSYVAVADYIYNKFLAAKVSLGFADVWYGDQALVPRVPALCVEPGQLTRTLEGVSYQALNDFTTMIMIYHAGIKDTQITKKKCDEQAEAACLFLNADPQLGGLVVWGFCNQVEPGYANRGGELQFATRITWQGLTKTRVA